MTPRSRQQFFIHEAVLQNPPRIALVETLASTEDEEVRGIIPITDVGALEDLIGQLTDLRHRLRERDSSIIFPPYSESPEP